MRTTVSGCCYRIIKKEERERRKKRRRREKKKERKEEKRFIISNLNFKALSSLASSLLTFSRALEGASPELESV